MIAMKKAPQRGPTPERNRKPMAPNRRTTRAAVSVAERRAAALQLRIGGSSFREIADALKLGNPGTAYRDVQAALTDAVTVPSREVLAVELLRLDQIVAALWPAVREGDTAACRVALQVMTRRAAYLGLDSPDHTIITTTDPSALTPETASKMSRAEILTAALARLNADADGMDQP